MVSSPRISIGPAGCRINRDYARRGWAAETSYRVVPAHRNWQIETAAWIWPRFFHCALETRWLGVRKTCGIGLFYRNYRPLLQETGWLVSDFISVCLETRWLGQKKWFLSPGSTLYAFAQQDGGADTADDDHDHLTSSSSPSLACH